MILEGNFVRRGETVGDVGRGEGGDVTGKFGRLLVRDGLKMAVHPGWRRGVRHRHGTAIS